MTIKELRALIKNLPGDTEILIRDQDSSYLQQLHSAKTEECFMSPDYEPGKLYGEGTFEKCEGYYTIKIKALILRY